MTAKPAALGVVARLTLVTGLLFAATLLVSGAAQADAPAGSGTANNNYNVAAEGDAMESTLVDPSAPLIQSYSISPYGASALLNSLGQSFADAGAPYSPIIYGLPSLVNGLGSGGLLPALPPLPGYTSASYPGKPTGTEVIEGYNITANSSANDSVGKVSLGAQAPGADNPTMFATAETTANDDGSVTATATAGADVLNIGQLLDLANLSSTLTLTVPTSGAPTIKSTEDVGTVTLLGLKTGLTLGGLNILGKVVPLPLTGTILSALNGLLSKAGISLSYLPETYTYTDGSHSTGSEPDSSKTLQSVESGALQVALAENVPSQGHVTFTYTLGRAYVSATNAPGFNSGGSSPESSPLPPSGGNSPTGGETPIATPAATATPSVGNPTPALSPTGTTSTGPTAAGPLTAPVGTTAPSSPPREAASRLTAVAGPSNESLYLLILLGAVFAGVAGQLIRLLAVRLTLFQGR